MAHSVCPWWIGYLLASPLRRLRHNPAQILGPYVCEGMTVVEPGPGMGFFTLELACIVGPAGRVVAVDVQSKMLDVLRRRAAKAGLLSRIDLRQAQPDTMGLGDLEGMADFVLAFAMVHEMPSAHRFFQEAAQVMKPDAALLFAEPAGHVTPELFDAELAAAGQAGLTASGHPAIRRTQAALLKKQPRA